MKVSYDLSRHRAPQVGLIVLQADETLERDFRVLIPHDIEVLVSRVPSGDHVTPDSLAAMEAELARAASLFPKGAKLSAVAYGCTSGTAEIGIKAVERAITSGIETPQVTQPVSALVAACRHLSISRIGLLSPYIPQVSDKLCATLAASGIETTAIASFGQSEEEKVVRISPASVEEAAVQLAAQTEMDGLFVSCTNLRTLDRKSVV